VKKQRERVLWKVLQEGRCLENGIRRGSLKVCRERVIREGASRWKFLRIMLYTEEQLLKSRNYYNSRQSVAVSLNTF
jgi:hypothetical protein